MILICLHFPYVFPQARKRKGTDVRSCFPSSVYLDQTTENLSSETPLKQLFRYVHQSLFATSLYISPSPPPTCVFNPPFLFGKSVIWHRFGSILTVSATFPSRAYGSYNTSCTRISWEIGNSQTNSKKALFQQYAHIWWLLLQLLLLSNKKIYYEKWKLLCKLNKWTGPFYVIFNGWGKKITFPYSCSHLLYIQLWILLEEKIIIVKIRLCLGTSRFSLTFFFLKVLRH